jgi:hypothetical protein
LLNDKSHKVVRQKNRNIGEQYEHNYFKGINEGDLPQFENEYNDYRKNVNFGQNYKAVGNKRTSNALPSKYN